MVVGVKIWRLISAYKKSSGARGLSLGEACSIGGIS